MKFDAQQTASALISLGKKNVSALFGDRVDEVIKVCTDIKSTLQNLTFDQQLDVMQLVREERESQNFETPQEKAQDYTTTIEYIYVNILNDKYLSNSKTITKLQESGKPNNEIIAEEMIENMQQEIACLQPYQQDKLQQEIDTVQNGNQDEFYLQDNVFYKHDKNLASKITEESVELYSQVVEKVVGPFYTEDSFGPVQ